MRKVFLDNLPQSKSGYIDWTNSIGKKITERILQCYAMFLYLQ